MNKQKIKEIIKFSLRKNIQNKWFIILNVLFFMMILFATNAGNIGNFLETNNINLFDKNISIKYIDKDSLIGNSLEEAFKENEEMKVEKIEQNNYTEENIEDNIIVEVFPDEEEIIKAKIISKEGIDGLIYDKILKVLDDKKIEAFSEKYKVERSKLENLEEGVSVERIMIGVNSENSDKKTIVEYVSTMIMYTLSIFIFSKIANEIAQEKVSKSIEYVLTSVTAKEYLLAKIISIVLTVVLQGIYLLAYYMMGNLVNNLINMDALATDTEIGMSTMFEKIDLDLLQYIAVVFVYGILTIILMAIIQAALSSKTTSMQEAGNSMMFLLTITIGVYMLTFVLITPYTNMSFWIYVLSCIPLISNFFIPAILVIGQATVLQMVVSFVILVASIPIAFNICSKVFKNGVLDYKQGKKKKGKVKKELSLIEEQELRLEKSRLRKLGFVAGIAMILFVSLEVVFNIAIEIFIVPVLSKFLSDVAIELISQILISALALGLASYFVHLYIRKPDETVVANKELSKKLFYSSFVLIGLLQIVTIAVQNWMGVDKNMSSILLDVEGLNNPLNCILFFIEIAVTPAIFEELFFRKSMIDLSRSFGDKFGILFSSFIFAIAHMNFSQAIFAFFMGVVLGTLYVKTGKMRYNMIIHLVNNGYAAIVAILIFNNWDIATIVFELILLVMIAVSGLTLAELAIDIFKKKEKFEWPEGKLLPKNFKYILTDYTVIITIIFTALLFTTTEVILKTM